MLEKDIERIVCEYAKSKDILAYKFTSPANAAVCDRIFIGDRKVWFAEFKRNGLKATPLQSRHHQKLAKRGISVYLIDSVELGKEIVDHESQQTTNGHHRAAIRYIDSNTSPS